MRYNGDTPLLLTGVGCFFDLYFQDKTTAQPVIVNCPPDQRQSREWKNMHIFVNKLIIIHLLQVFKTKFHFTFPFGRIYLYIRMIFLQKSAFFEFLGFSFCKFFCMKLQNNRIIHSFIHLFFVRFCQNNFIMLFFERFVLTHALYSCIIFITFSCVCGCARIRRLFNWVNSLLQN